MPDNPVDNSVILFISDDQSPYGHKDRFDFVWSLKHYLEPYGKVKVVHLGDETDQHYNSNYTKKLKLHGPTEEESATQLDLDQWEACFPDLDLVMSNHTARIYKKAEEAGITDRWLRTLNEAYDKPNWTWHRELNLYSSGQRININHGEKSSAYKIAQLLGCTVVQGHRHSEFYIQAFNNGEKTYYGVQAGSLIDPTSPAFEYGRNNPAKSVLGTAAIIHGVPRLFPFLLDKKGRWTGQII
jgi:hypothetical protein